MKSVLYMWEVRFITSGWDYEDEQSARKGAAEYIDRKHIDPNVKVCIWQREIKELK